MITDDDVDHYKPNIECLQTAINQMKLENTEILYVGDHLRDFEMAQKAGTPFAAVLWSKSPEEQAEFRDELKDDEVMWFLEHPKELLQKLGT
jgi:phosphoglycolate phosphatase-like HAD superfamily hydrolase